MPLLLSPEQELIKKVVREFAEQDLAPDATRCDRESRFPREHVAKMAPLGLLGMLVPADKGGAGTDTLSFAVALEEAARVSGTDAAFMVLANTIGSFLLSQSATDAQRARILGPALKGETILATALVEEASGSQHEAVRTTARAVKEGFELTGSKAFVALAGHADHYLVLATAPEGPSFFHLPKGAPGLYFSEQESKLGLRGLPLADMYLNRVRAGPDDVVGAPGEALKLLEEPIDLARLGTSAALVGLAQAALEMAIDFAKNRVQFGQPIAQFGAIRGMIADVQAELEAARATTYGAAALRDSLKPYTEQVHEARLLAHRIAVKGTRISHKIHGGAGFMRDLPLERVSRDVRTLMHLWDAQDVSRAHLADLILGPPQ